ncbi:glycoside hydrolase family 27 protein [Algibacter mikhailovii]|uniref:glycoside hydrolase family 27 protein n=1 Tax=Algibacter mikhailovii TaxID=425498 RepID=UPI002493DC38|nr:glycoside hydrolase family 27 protein [Algibacter mikhailovii]
MLSTKQWLPLIFSLFLFKSCLKTKKNDINDQQKLTFNTSKILKLAPTPPMGWNSWNWFGKKNINENVVKETIDAMVATGLKDAGYEYVVVDGGWRAKELGEKGELLVHKEKFPNGIKALADYAHSKGLKFGVHVVPGSHDCGGDAVGGFKNEETHVNQFVEWGLDLIKLDLCNQHFDPCSDCTKSRSGWSEESIETTYRKWQNLLENCGRAITFSISAYAFRDWYPETCNMARTTGDIESRIHKGAYFHKDTINHKFLSVLDIAEINNRAADKAGNGYWNDPDMMVTGENGLNEDEQVSHFNLWCIMSSPLFIGSDPRNMGAFEKDLLTNEELLAINQDPTEQGKLISSDGIFQVWHKKLKDGKSALLVFCLTEDNKKSIRFDISEIGFDETAKFRDVIHNTDVEIRNNQLVFNLRKHESRMLLISH